MSEWNRVSTHRPCTVCGKPDWCTYRDDGASCCMRVQSDKTLANGGWIHGGEPHKRPAPPSRPRGIIYPPPDFHASLWWRTGRHLMRDQLGLDPWAMRLGLPVGALSFMGATTMCGMLCFPMHDGHGEICGIRTRNQDGSKKAIYGSRAGVFLPTVTMPEYEVLICEGPTDSAAAIELDFDPIGRPSCLGQEVHVLDTLRRWGRTRATICADADGPGINGAHRLAEVLRAGRIAIRIVTPVGHKDLRDLYKSGAKRSLVDAAWSQAAWR